MTAKYIIAVVGLPGAGKTEATDHLVQKTGWPKVYFGQGVMDEIARRGLAVNEQNEKLVREDLRAQHGMAAMAIVNMPKITELFARGNVMVESLYGWEEYLVVKKEFGDQFKVLAIFSSYATRAARMVHRPMRPLTPEELAARDAAQIANLHQAGPIARADWTIINEGSKEDLFKQLDEWLSSLTFA